MRRTTSALLLLGLTALATGCVASDIEGEQSEASLPVVDDSLTPQGFTSLGYLPLPVDPTLLTPPSPVPPLTISSSPIRCSSPWGLHPGVELDCSIARTDVASVTWRITDGATRTVTGLRMQHVLRTRVAIQAEVALTSDKGAKPLVLSTNITASPYDHEDLSTTTIADTERNAPSFALTAIPSGFAMGRVERIMNPSGLPFGAYPTIQVGVKEAAGWTRSFVMPPTKGAKENLVLRRGHDGLLRLAFVWESAPGRRELTYARATVARPTGPSQWVVTNLGAGGSGVNLGFELRSDDRPVFTVLGDGDRDQMRLLISRTATPTSRDDLDDIGVDGRTDFTGFVLMGANAALALDGDVPVIVYDTTLVGPLADGSPAGTVFARATSASPRSSADFAKHRVGMNLLRMQLARVGGRYCLSAIAGGTKLYCASSLFPTSEADWTATTVTSERTPTQTPRLAALGDRPVVLTSSGLFLATSSSPVTESDFVFESLSGRATEWSGNSPALLVIESGGARGIYAASLSSRLTTFLDRLY